MALSPFFRLPRELRDVIYRYTLVQPEPIKVWSSRSEVRKEVNEMEHDVLRDFLLGRRFELGSLIDFPLGHSTRRTGLLATCRKLSEEAGSIMYGENTFELDEYYSLNHITPKHLKIVRNLSVKLFLSPTEPKDNFFVPIPIVQESMPALIRRSRQLCTELRTLAHPSIQTLIIDINIGKTGLGKRNSPLIRIYALPDGEIVILWCSWDSNWGGFNLRPIVEPFKSLGASNFSVKGVFPVMDGRDDNFAASLTRLLEEGEISKDTFERAMCRSTR